MSDGKRLERRRALRRECQRRYRKRINAHKTCATLTLGESGLQALLCAGFLKENEAHLKQSIAVATQVAFDLWAAEELAKAGLR